jgi:hypothetical protein
MIPQLVDSLSKLRASIQKADPSRRAFGMLPGITTRPLSTVYRSAIAELSPNLTARERDLLHIVHEYLRVGDELLCAYDHDLRAAATTCRCSLRRLDRTR